MGHHQVDQYMHYSGFGRRKEKGHKTIQRNMAKNFPNLRKDTDIQIQEPQ